MKSTLEILEKITNDLNERLIPLEVGVIIHEIKILKKLTVYRYKKVALPRFFNASYERYGKLLYKLERFDLLKDGRMNHSIEEWLYSYPAKKNDEDLYALFTQGGWYIVGCRDKADFKMMVNDLCLNLKSAEDLKSESTVMVLCGLAGFAASVSTLVLESGFKGLAAVCVVISMTFLLFGLATAIDNRGVQHSGLVEFILRSKQGWIRKPSARNG